MAFRATWLGSQKLDTVVARTSRPKTNWDVWIRWYDAVLDGRPTPGGEALDIFRVILNSQADWEKGPAHVNGLIAAKEREIAARSFSKPEEENLDLSQRPSGHVFDFENGRLVAKPVYGSVADQGLASELRQAIAAKALDAAERLARTQCPSKFSQSFRNLAEFLQSVSDEHPAVGKLLMLSRTLDAYGAALLSADM